MPRSILWAALATLTLLAMTGCDEEGDKTTIVIDDSHMYGILIERQPGYLLVPGLENPLYCFAYFEGDARQDWTDRVTWSVSDPTWATITRTGVLTPLREGSGIVRAKSPEGWVSDQTFWVPRVVSLDLQGDERVVLIGDDIPVRVIAGLSAGYNEEVGPLVPLDWTVSNPAVVHATTQRTLHADAMGNTAVTATLSGVVGNPLVLTVDSVTNIYCVELSDPPYLPLDTIIFSAYGYGYLTGLWLMTSLVEWTVSDPTTLLPLGYGRFLVMEPGDFTVTASYDGLSAYSGYFSMWEVASVALDPSEIPDTVARGDTVQFVAQATIVGHGEQDLTARALWQCSDTTIGTFAAPGMFIARGNGRCQVHAEVGLKWSPSVAVTVFSPALLDEDFESYPVGNFNGNALWEVWVGGTGTRVGITDLLGTRAHVCVLVDSTYSNNAGINTMPDAIGAVTVGTVDMDVMAGYGMSIFIGGPYSSYAAVEIYFSNGNVYVNDSWVSGYSNASWYHLNIVFDCATDRFDFALNDQRLVQNGYFYNSQTYVDYLAWYTTPSSTHGVGYLDNVVVDGIVISTMNRTAPPHDGATLSADR